MLECLAEAPPEFRDSLPNRKPDPQRAKHPQSRIRCQQSAGGLWQTALRQTKALPQGLAQDQKSSGRRPLHEPLLVRSEHPAWKPPVVQAANGSRGSRLRRTVVASVSGGQPQSQHVFSGHCFLRHHALQMHSLDSRSGDLRDSYPWNRLHMPMHALPQNPMRWQSMRNRRH